MSKLRSIDPATGMLNEEIPYHSDEDINEKVVKSTAAFNDWSDENVVERTFLLEELARIIRRRENELATLITKEMGKPIKESLAEIEKCAWACDYFAEKTESFLKVEKLNTDASESFIEYRPMGTVLSIMPWNFPFWQALRFGVPAVAGGNTVLLKHASNVPLCAIELERIFVEAGFPEGIYQTLLIDGPTASSLISRPEINAVTLTGSLNAGSMVAQMAGKNIKKFVLELGGSDPFIVLKDADIEDAAKAAVKSRFQNNGQSCIAAKRILVDETVEEEFISYFLNYVKELRVGHPFDKQTDIGPLANETQLNILIDQVERTIKMGANILIEGGLDKREGYYYNPTVLNGLDSKSPVLQEEVFGPVAPIVPFKTQDEAVKIANSTEFGLGASIWGRDKRNALSVASSIDAGIFGINSPVASDPRVPFGGVKKSGVGRELYRIGMMEFMQPCAFKIF
ncbi:NAD-dependent succinate-semialdehyde dehydrogenase [Methanosalsum natronophilum]|nr:NAD-dependent succinate-semialdehyde dehydrogenase [Methanosalsum natronophilum]MCS3924533.1 succinate-semialdehyde dehydrogenase/glutarate-semialdehyde dehydrogenase [Methanosalsum natronophilum]